MLQAAAERLEEVASGGSVAPPTIYERDNFQEVGEMAAALRALLANGAAAEFQPLAAPLPSAPGPVAVGDAAVFDESGRLLLIQRADNRHWAFPGGALEVGEAAADGVIREAREETGVIAVPRAFIALHDSGLLPGERVIRLFHNLFLCTSVGTTTVYHPHEVVDSGWFSRDALPAPLDPGHARRIPVAFAAWDGERAAFFAQEDG
jgi:8-oxo-dGTP pyrophosphatase MutT (NUDIX family)